MSPYRNAAGIDRSGEEPECADADLVPVILVVWLGSIARVARALSRAEPFGAEPTIALFAIAFLPFLAKGAAVWWFRHRRWLRARGRWAG